MQGEMIGAVQWRRRGERGNLVAGCNSRPHNNIGCSTPTHGPWFPSSPRGSVCVRGNQRSCATNGQRGLGGVENDAWTECKGACTA